MMFKKLNFSMLDRYYSSDNKKVLEFTLDGWNTNSTKEEGKNIAKIIIEDNAPIKIFFKDRKYRYEEEVINKIEKGLKDILAKYILTKYVIKKCDKEYESLYNIMASKAVTTLSAYDVKINNVMFNGEKISYECYLETRTGNVIICDLPMILQGNDIIQQLKENKKSLYDILRTNPATKTLVNDNPIVTSITLKDVIETIQNCFEIEEIEDLFTDNSILDIYKAVCDDIEIDGANGIVNAITKNFNC